MEVNGEWELFVALKNSRVIAVSVVVSCGHNPVENITLLDTQKMGIFMKQIVLVRLFLSICICICLFVCVYEHFPSDTEKASKQAYSLLQQLNEKPERPP